MSPAPDSTLDDPQKIIADLQCANAELQRRLDDRTDERDEGLQRETATAKVLQIINSSAGDLAPVFDAMIEKATRLCDATHGQLATYDGEFFRFVAVHGEPGFAETLLALGPRLPDCVEKVSFRRCSIHRSPTERHLKNWLGDQPI